jgi:hypothetical protein
VDEEIRRLFLETVEALEAVLVAVQVERYPDQSTIEGRDFVRREAVRRLVRLRQAIEREEPGGS